MGGIDDWFSSTQHCQGYTPRDDIIDRLDEGEDVQEEVEADMGDHIRQRQMQQQQDQQERRPPPVTQLSQEQTDMADEEEVNHGGDDGNHGQQEGWSSPVIDENWLVEGVDLSQVPVNSVVNATPPHEQREEQREEERAVSHGQVDAQDTSQGDGDSNRNMFLLHLAGLTVQRDSPLRPADAHGNSSRPDHPSNQQHNNQEQANQAQDGWPTDPPSVYEPERLRRSFMIVPMPNNPGYRLEGMFQDLYHLIPHVPTRLVVSTLMPGLANEFLTDISGNPFDEDHDDRAQRLLSANLQSSHGATYQTIQSIRHAMGGGDGDDDDGNGDDDFSVSSDEEEDEDSSTKHPICKRYKTVKAHRRTWRAIHNVAAFMLDFYLDRHSLLREMHLKLRNQCRNLVQAMAKHPERHMVSKNIIRTLLFEEP